MDGRTNGHYAINNIDIFVNLHTYSKYVYEGKLNELYALLDVIKCFNIT